MSKSLIYSVSVFLLKSKDWHLLYSSYSNLGNKLVTNLLVYYNICYDFSFKFKLINEMIFTIHFKFKLQRNWWDARRQCCPRCCCSNSHCRNSSSTRSRSHCSNCQETRTTRVRQSKATRTLIAYSLYQSVFTLDTLIKFSATGTHAPENISLSSTGQSVFIFFLPPTYVGGAVRKGFRTDYKRGTVQHPLEVSTISYGDSDVPSPVLYLIQDLREMAGRTALVQPTPSLLKPASPELQYHTRSLPLLQR